MKKINENLSEYTWLKIGGPAEIAIPESKKEYVELLKRCHEKNRSYKLLGGGSNLLVNDEGIEELVIKNTDACTDFKQEGTKVSVGSSMMIPQFVRKCVENNLGGYEYLYSVPGTVGGGIYMNAGRGKSYKQTISDHLTSVEVFIDGEIRILEKEELCFKHRWSTFQSNNDWVILSANFDLPEQSAERGNALIKKRMEKVRKRERGQPNAGSVFNSNAPLPLQKIPPNGLSVDGARFVSKNRICHNGNADFDDVYKLLKRAKILNTLVPPFKQPEVEWVIWD